MPDGLLVRAEDRPLGSNLTAVASAGDVTLHVEWAGRFPDEPGTVTLNGAFLPYSAADEEAATVELVDPLEVAADVGDQVVLANGDQELAARDAYVVLPTSEQPIIVDVPHEMQQLVPVGDEEDVYADPWPVTVDEGLDHLVTVQGRQPLADGGYLAPVSVAAGALSTSAAGDDVVNGTFEDWTPLGFAARFDGWRPSWGWGGIGAAIVSVTQPGEQIAGNVSAVIACGNDAAGLRLITDRIYPVRGGQVIDVSLSLRASRVVDRSATATPELVAVVVHTTGTEGKDPEDLFDPDVLWQNAVTLAQVDTVAKPYSGSVTIPEGHNRMRISVGAEPSGDGAGWTLYFDEVHKSLAVDPAEPQRIDELSVGTLSVDSVENILIGGQTLGQWLAANYTPLAAAPVTRTFSATGMRTYDQGDARIEDSAGPLEAYGQTGYNSTYGNRKCVVTFDSAAIAAYLAGKTITKVEAYLYCSLRGGTGTGIIPVGFHSSSTPQLDYSTVTGKAPNAFRPGGFKAGAGQWFDVTSVVADWVSGTKKGLILGPGQTALNVLSSAPIYSNRVSGIGSATLPKLKFTTT